MAASDISPAMVDEAKKNFEAASTSAAAKAPAPSFEAVGLEEVKGSFDTVCCLDVLIHYPTDRADGMVSHLGSLAKDRLILSFAPNTPWLSILRRIGELAPGPSKVRRWRWFWGSTIHKSKTKLVDVVRQSELRGVFRHSSATE